MRCRLFPFVVVSGALAIACTPRSPVDSTESKADPLRPEASPAKEAPTEEPSAPERPREPEPPGSTEPQAPPQPEPATANAEPAVDSDFVEDPLVHPLPSLPRGGAFESNDALLSEKMERRIRSKLRRQHGVVVLLPKRIVVPGDKGGVHVVGLYSYSLLDACVAAKGGGSEARSACIQQANLDERGLVGGEAYEIPACTWRGLVHAYFGPAPEGKAEYGGPLSIVARRAIGGACLLQSVDTFRLYDADADEKAELEVIVTSADPSQDFRAQNIELPKHRNAGWFQGSTLVTQHEQWLSFEGIMQTANIVGHSEVRYRFLDVNKDGAPDLRIAGYDLEDAPEVTWVPSNDTWTATDFVETQSASFAAANEESDLELSDVLIDETLLYDAEHDRWEAPEGSP